MTTQAFAERHRLKVRRDEDNELIISGKRGHIYDHGDGQQFGLMFMPGRPRLWANARRKLEAPGFLVWQDGDEEGSALFDPSNAAQVRLALKVVGVKRKRNVVVGARSLANLRRPSTRGGSGGPETPFHGGEGDGVPEAAIQVLGAQVGAQSTLKA